MIFTSISCISAQALSGVFLAEQIRQQQLAAALESRLSESAKATSGSDFMQAALLMNKINTGGAAQTPGGVLDASETSKLLAIAAAAAAANKGPTNEVR